MADRNDFRKYGDIRVRYETPEERQRAVEILEARGFEIPDVLKDPASFYAGGTHLLAVNLRWKKLDFNLPAFICACMGSAGIRLYSVQELERLSELKFRVVPRFPVFHVPHDGWEFPASLSESVCVPEEVLRDYHERMRDRDVKQLIPSVYRGGQMLCSFDVSRLLCDVERFIGPEEVMERYGMGFCYEKVYDGTVIRHVTEEVRKQTLRYYREHHRRMDELCERHPRMLLFDMHSWREDIVPHDFLREGIPMPDLCIGTDERYTPPALTEIVQRRFAEAGFGMAVNYPYPGCFVPDCVMSGRSACDYIGIMLEFHRNAYLDVSGEPDPVKTERIRRVIRQIMADCAEL